MTVAPRVKYFARLPPSTYLSRPTPVRRAISIEHRGIREERHVKKGVGPINAWRITYGTLKKNV